MRTKHLHRMHVSHIPIDVVQIASVTMRLAAPFRDLSHERTAVSVSNPQCSQQCSNTCPGSNGKTVDTARAFIAVWKGVFSSQALRQTDLEPKLGIPYSCKQSISSPDYLLREQRASTTALLAMKCRAKPNAEEQSVTQDAWSSGVRGVYHRLARKPSEQRVSTTALHATHRHV